MCTSAKHLCMKEKKFKFYWLEKKGSLYSLVVSKHESRRALIKECGLNTDRSQSPNEREDGPRRLLHVLLLPGGLWRDRGGGRGRRGRTAQRWSRTAAAAATAAAASSAQQGLPGSPEAHAVLAGGLPRQVGEHQVPGEGLLQAKAQLLQERQLQVR